MVLNDNNIPEAKNLGQTVMKKNESCKSALQKRQQNKKLAKRRNKYKKQKNKIETQTRGPQSKTKRPKKLRLIGKELPNLEHQQEKITKSGTHKAQRNCQTK